MVWSVGLIIIFFMLLLNAVFAAYEMALASISRAKISILVNQKRKGAVETAFMKDNIEASLAVIQVGITLVGSIAAATGGAGIVSSLAPQLISAWGISKTLANVVALFLFIIPLSSLTIIFSELIPKSFALSNRAWVCLRLSPLMKFLFMITYPVIRIFEKIVKAGVAIVNKKTALQIRREESFGWHELVAAASLARTSKLIGAREEKIVLAAAQLSVRPLKSIMLPANDIFMIPLENRLSEALVRAHLDMHTRFPICSKEGDPQSIQGYVNFKDIVVALQLNPSDPTIKGILRPIKFLKESLTLAEALEQMIQEKMHIAMVHSAEGIVIGMITLEDIIEELLGNIEDEYDRLPVHVHPYEAGWVMGGGLSMSAVEAVTSKQLVPVKSEESSVRLADWFSQQIRSELKGGEIIETNGLQFMARKLRRKKLSEAVVTRTPPKG